MIKESVEGKLGFSLGLEQCKREGNFIATISKYHRDLDISQLKDKSLAGKDLRLSLLSALLRLGDKLDGDYRRVNLRFPKIWEVPPKSKYHWWGHYYVQSISIIDLGKIKVDLAFPKIYKQDDITKAFKICIHSSIKTTFDEVYDILWGSGIRLHPDILINEQDEEIGGLEPVHNDVRTYINEHVLKSIKVTKEVDVPFRNRWILQCTPVSPSSSWWVKQQGGVTDAVP